MLTVGKEATPLTGTTPPPPVRTAPGVPVPAEMASAIGLAYPVATFPKASLAVTSICGTITWFATALLGGTVNSSVAAAPGLMTKNELNPSDRPGDVAARRNVPDLSMLRPGNDATPAAAVCMRVPLRVAPAV